MGAYAWYYNDHTNGVSYWAYAYEISATEFAARVSSETGRYIRASDTSYADGQNDLDKHQRGMLTVQV